MKFLTTLFFVLTLFSASLFAQDPRSNLRADDFPFYHGVASGDPDQQSVIIWTRVSPDEAIDSIKVKWRVATDPQFRKQKFSGKVFAKLQDDYTVKILVEGLSPNTTYYYDFEALGFASLPGRTKTFPAGDVSNVRFGVVSCSNYEYGYFNAYNSLNERQDLDAILHLGDYIYEYGIGEYSANIPGREHEPATEMVTLSDYRTRYSHYRLDADLKELHRQYPFITVWDDHESTNDSYRDGAENHTEGAEGSWVTRKGYAMKAYNEWMPIRSFDWEKPIYRSFQIGNLMSLVMLDTRLFDRDKQLELPGLEAGDPNRRLIGDKQFAWLRSELSNFSTQWKIIGQQVMMAPLKVGGIPINMDQWDGYTFERDRLFSYIKSQNIQNFVVLTGDIHTSWAMDLPEGPLYLPQLKMGSAGVEYVVTSVTSPGLDEIPGDLVRIQNPHMKYVDLVEHGYMVLDVNKARAQADWYFTEDLSSPSNVANWATSYFVPSGDRFLQQASAPSPNRISIGELAPNSKQRSTTPTALKEVNQLGLTGIFPDQNKTVRAQIFGFEATEATFEIFSTNGQLIHSEPIMLKEGINYAEVNLSEYASGVYIAVVRTDQQSVSSKFKL